MKRKIYWFSAALLCLLLVCLPVYAQASQAVEQTDTVDADVPVITVEKQRVEMIRKPELLDADGNKDIAAPDMLRTDVSYVYPCEGVVLSNWFVGTKMQLPFYEYSRGARNGSTGERMYISLTRNGQVIAAFEGSFEQEAGWYTWTLSIEGSENWNEGTVYLSYYSTNDRGNRDKLPMPINIFYADSTNPGNLAVVDMDLWEQHFDCGVLERAVFKVSSQGYGGQTYYAEISDSNKVPVYHREGQIPLKHGTTLIEIVLEEHLRPGTYYMRAFSSGQREKMDVYYPFYIDNKGVAWCFDKATGTLTFFGNGDMPHYPTNVDQPWEAKYMFDAEKEVRCLTVEPGITSVSADLCKNYSGLKQVSLPQGLRTIEMFAFAQCGLETVALPNSVSTIGCSAFEACSQLKSVTTFGVWQEPGTAAKGIQSDAFRSGALETVEIPASVPKLGALSFFCADNLKTVKFQDELPEFDAETFEITPAITAYYPRQLTSWTEESLGDYGGDVTWQSYDLPLGKVNVTKTQAHATGNIVYWDAVRFADLYQVYRREASETGWTLIKNTRSLAYKDESAECEVKYYYKVRARNGSWMSSLDMPARSAVRPYGLPKVQMTSAAGFKEGISVYWKAAEGAKTYQVFRRAQNETEWILLAETDSLAYRDETGIPGVTYFFKVRARNGVLISSLDIKAVSAARLYPLDPVRMTKAIGHATGNIIYWEAVENAKIYQVYRRAADETTWTLIKNTGSLGYKDTGAESGVKYYYKVVARNGDLRSGMNISAVSAIRP